MYHLQKILINKSVTWSIACDWSYEAPGSVNDFMQNQSVPLIAMQIISWVISGLTGREIILLIEMTEFLNDFSGKKYSRK